MSAVTDRRVRGLLRDALNGQAESIDPAVRRGLTVLAVVGDDIEDRIVVLDGRQHVIEEGFQQLKRAVYGTGATVVVTIVGSVAAVLARI